MRLPERAARHLAVTFLAATALLAVPPVRGQPHSTSRVWSTALSGWNLPTEQSAHEVHPGPAPRTWRVTLHPRSVNWYRVQAFATGAAPVMAQLTAGGRPMQGPRQLNAPTGYATDWIVCTSPANAPLVLEVRAGGAAEWAFGLWVPPTSVPLGPCP